MNTKRALSVLGTCILATFSGFALSKIKSNEENIQSAYADSTSELAFSITDSNLSVGETLQLTLYYQGVEVPIERYSLTSSNPDVATISSTGLVTAVGGGSTLISAYGGQATKTGEGAYCNIGVKIVEQDSKKNANGSKTNQALEIVYFSIGAVAFVAITVLGVFFWVKTNS